jgi:sugar O-acyltransferase (sialic acid O-acetyltransferase NeuD family)
MDVIIYGAGGLGREVYDTLLLLNLKEEVYNVLGFIDDGVEKNILVNGLPVLGGADALEELQGEIGIILAVANPSIRKQLHKNHKARFKFPNIIHPAAIISKYSSIGEAILIQAFCIVAANAKVGDGVMMNAHSGVGHDAQVDDYCSIMSFCDLAGNSKLGTLSFVGTGAKVIPGISIAAESYLCAGAVVFKNVENKSKLLGNPAKIIF